MVFVGAGSALFGEIHTIHSLKEMDQHLQNAGSESLIVFDIDETLLTPEKPSFQRPNIEKHRQIIREVLKNVEKEKHPLLVNVMLLESGMLLIEDRTPDLIKSWQKKGIKTIALSSAMSGEIDGVDLLEKRLRHFEETKIDFSTSFPDHKELIFPNHNIYYGASARFKQGVLHSNSCHRAKSAAPEKGPILIEFLSKAKCSPKAIFFADDKLEILQEVEKTLREKDPTIKFIGFHYQGAFHYPSKLLTEEEMKADWQKLVEVTNSLPMK